MGGAEPPGGEERGDPATIHPRGALPPRLHMGEVHSGGRTKPTKEALTTGSVAGSTSEGTGGGGGYCIVPYLAASVSVRSTLPDVEQTF